MNNEPPIEQAKARRFLQGENCCPISQKEKYAIFAKQIAEATKAEFCEDEKKLLSEVKNI